MRTQGALDCGTGHAKGRLAVCMLAQQGQHQRNGRGVDMENVAGDQHAGEDQRDIWQTPTIQRLSLGSAEANFVIHIDYDVLS